MIFFEINGFNFSLCSNTEELYQNAGVSLDNDVIWDMKSLASAVV